MRHLALLLLSVIGASCAAKQPPVTVQPEVRTDALTDILARVATWQLPSGAAHVSIEIDDHGEGIVLEKLDGIQRVWVTLCGPDELRHREAFERFLTVHALECSMYTSERTVGCREGYVCRDGKTTQTLAELGGALLRDVFNQVSTEVVRYRCF